MQQVVDEAGLKWLDTPDQAVVWGTALGLQSEIEGVLSRSLEDVKTAGTRQSRAASFMPVLVPRTQAGPRRSSRPRPRRRRQPGSSLFSDSRIPDVAG